MRKPISFIIINYKTYETTLECIISILSNPSFNGKVDELLLIDNASFDGSLEKLSADFQDELTIIPSEENLGFGKANNLGASRAKNPLLLFINNDTLADNTDFTVLSEVYVDTPDIGFLTTKILNGDLTIQSIGHPMPNLLVDFDMHMLFRESTIRKRLRFHNYKNRGLFRTGWISGCFMMISREVFSKIGGFDENIFMYAEDIDISYHIEQAGLVNYCYDKTSIIHLSGGSMDKSDKISLQKMLEPLKNYFYVLKKNNMVSGLSLIFIKFFCYLHTLLFWLSRKVCFLKDSTAPNTIGKTS